MGHLQWHPRLAKFRNLRLRPLLRLLLARGHPRIPSNAIQRDKRPLAADESKERKGGNERKHNPEQWKFDRVHRSRS